MTGTVDDVLDDPVGTVTGTVDDTLDTVDDTLGTLLGSGSVRLVRPSGSSGSGSSGSGSERVWLRLERARQRRAAGRPARPTQVQTAPYAAEPTSFVYFASTPPG